MKNVILFLSILLFSLSCTENPGQKTQEVETPDQESKDLFPSYTDFETKELSKSLTADFTGDGVKDRARFKRFGEKYGIEIKDGTSGETHQIGGGVNLKKIGDDFEWAEVWGVLNDKKTWEGIYEDGLPVGTRKVNLKHSAIILSTYESGGGLIYMHKGQFVWIHQGE